MTKTDKIEIGVKKLKTILLSVAMIAFVFVPIYLVDFTDIASNDFTLLIIYPTVAVFLLYYTYRYLIKRILMGPIITLTRDSMVVKNEGTVHTYPWSTIIKVKVEVVSEKDFEGKIASPTILTVWTSNRNDSDEFNISDLEMSSDEIRELLNNYTLGSD